MNTSGAHSCPGWSQSSCGLSKDKSFTHLASRDQVAEHRVAQLRLEPGAFGGHDSTAVRDGHQLLDAGREHGEGAGKSTAFHQTFQFRSATNAADEVDAVAGTWVVNAKQRGQDVFLEQRRVELFDRIGRRGEFRAEIERVPSAVEKKTNFMFARRRAGTVSFNDEYAVEQFEH